MISAWHLLWIVPSAVGFGVFLSAFLHAASENSKIEEEWGREEENP